jgi:glycogenin
MRRLASLLVGKVSKDSGRGALPRLISLACTLCCFVTAAAVLSGLGTAGTAGAAGAAVTAGTGANFIVLYLACNRDGMLGATVSARSAVGKGFSSDVGVLAVKSRIAANETAAFAALSPRARVFWVDELSNPAEMTADDVSNAKQCRYSKIHAWGLTQYDRILLLDTDTLVMQNLDSIFTRSKDEPIAAVQDSVGDIFNTGVMLIRPDRALCARMISRKGDVASYNKGDQGFFNSFYGEHWRTLPSKYNVPVHSMDSAYVRAGLPASVAILHFTAEVKPWNVFRASAVKTGWKAMARPPWVWYALWHQVADLAGARPEECFSQRTLSSLARTKNDSQFSVMISTYDRPVAALAKVVALFERVPEAVEIFIVSHQVGRKLDRRLLQAATSKRLSVLYQATDTLNNRFRARLAFNTGAVYVCDDDIWVPPEDLSFGHKVWREHRDQIVGFFPRYHRADGTYEYDGRRSSYSMMLTKGMFLAPEYLFAYSCVAPEVSTRLVDSLVNCEDVLMNFIVTGITGKAPVSVQSSAAILDWGTKGGISSAGLAARSVLQNDHLLSRSHCIQEFRNTFAPVDLMHSDLAYTRFKMNGVVKAAAPPSA